MAVLDETGLARLWEKIKNYVNSVTGSSDSGWIKAPTSGYASKFNFYDNDEEANAVKYRKIGNVVEIIGTLHPATTAIMASGAEHDLFTLPEGFRPSHRSVVAIMQGSARAIFMARALPDGIVRIGRYRNATSTTDSYPSTVATSAWLPIHLIYTVD